MRSLFSTLVKTFVCVVVLVVGAYATTSAQDNSFRKGSFYLGPRIAIGSVGGAGLGYAINGEYGVEGPIGVFGTIGYSSYSEGLGGFSFDYTNIVIIVGGNVHFDLLKIQNLDTYAGISLGYNIGSWSNSVGGAYSGTSLSFFRLGGQIGGRYHISPSVALSGEAGWGIGIVKVGFDIRF